VITQAQLRQLPLFAQAGEETVALFARNSADVRFGPDEWIFHEGESPRFWLLLEGSVEVLKSIAGRLTTLARWDAGDSFGEVPILLNTCTLAGVKATTAVRLARVDPSVFWQMMHRDENFSRVVLANMSKRITRVEQVAIDTPEERCTIRGDSRSPACHELRDFMTRMHVAYSWEERAGNACELRFSDGSVLDSPTIQQLAQALGLSAVPHRSCYDVAIVGAGPAGLAAAVYGASEGLQTLLIEAYAPGGQAGMSSLIENYLGFPTGISGEDLADRAFRQAQRFGADIVVTREVRSLQGEPGERYLTLDDGQVVRARTVVLAPGVKYRRLPAEHCDDFLNRGVYYGAAQTESSRVNGRTIHLVGGGNSAGQAALYFSSYAQSVKIVIRGGDLRKDMSEYLVDRVAHQPNIAIATHSEVAAVGGNDHLERIALRTRDGTTAWEPSDGLFVFIGATPNTAWLKGFVACDERGFILTPNFLETNQPGVFAVGDARKDSIKRVAAGVGEGSSAIALVTAYLRSLTVSP
jgi:thioredoxin reductase (NADPH)